MLIPSIDLRGGQVVQLIQGERLAIASDDIFGWVRTFEGYPKVQLIDLDGAFGSGINDRLVRVISARLPCRVGGGIRSVKRAQQVLHYGATAVIVGSSLFKNGQPDIKFARKLADTVGSERIIVAVDSKGGRVVIKGWREALTLTPVEAIAVFEPYCSEFLYTHVDTEGLMGGIDMDAVRTRSARDGPAAHRRGRHHDARGDRSARCDRRGRRGGYGCVHRQVQADRPPRTGHLNA